MIIDDELGDAMRNLAFDSPTESEIAATVRARINRRHNKYRRTMLTTLAAVAAVAAIVTIASLLRSTAQSNDIQPGSTPPPIQAGSASVSVSVFCA